MDSFGEYVYHCVKQDSLETLISKTPFNSPSKDRCDFALGLQIE